MDLSKRDQRIIDRIIYKEPDVETYSGEFDETYNKKWFSEKEIRLAINKVKEKERELNGGRYPEQQRMNPYQAIMLLEKRFLGGKK